MAFFILRQVKNLSYPRFTLFKGIDTRSLGAFRIALGVAVLIDLLLFKLPYFSSLFIDSGIIPKELMLQLRPDNPFSILFYNSSEGFVLAFFSITIITAFLFTLGVYPNILAILLYVLLISIQNRIFFSLGSDVMLRMALLWSIFLPLKQYSIFYKNIEEKEIKNFAVIAILLQISIIYFFNALYKTGDMWREGTAAAYASMLAAYKMPFADHIIASPLLSELLTYFTIGFEYAIPFLIFSPFYPNITRLFAAVCIFLFHWGALPFINVIYFCIASAPFVVLLLPVEKWNRNNFKNVVASFSFNLKDIIVVPLIIAVLVVNIRPFYKTEPHGEQTFFNKLITKAGLQQRWALFAPEPTRINGYSLVLGELSNGKTIDLYSLRPLHDINYREKPYKYNSLPDLFFYVSYTVRLFYNKPIGNTISRNWAQYEYRRWMKKNPHLPLRKITIVHIPFYSVSVGEISTPELKFLYEYRFK